MNRKVKIIWASIISLLVLITALIIFAYHMLHQPLPIYEGQIEVSGLNNNVKIYRDKYAVPYIDAENEEDAAYALGFVHAQERLFQMDIARRAGEGRLSEVFGSSTIPFDKMFRTVGIYNAVVNHYENLSPLSKKLLTAYSAGVNAFIKQTGQKLSIEFDVLGYDPYEWKPEHSLVIAKLMAWELNISWWADITFSHLVQKFGAEKVKEIIPDYPENAPTIIPTNKYEYANLPIDFMRTDKAYRNFFGINGTHIGSNSWAINGEKSSSGKPIIANDPHLAFQAPGKWFVAVIRSPEWSVEGFTIPGLPGIVIGNNKSIAWGVTNLMADDADFYIEKLDSVKTKYLVDGEWLALETTKEILSVKDSLDVEFKIFSTHRGPIVSDIHTYNYLFPNEEQYKSHISMRWTALEFSDEMFAIQSVNKASSWNEFKDALSNFTVPGQNFVYADSAGNIGYVCAAKLPIRKNVSPTLIYDGTTRADDWTGYVSYKELPKLFNSKNNYIASANNKTQKSFKYHISNMWEPSSRIERIVHFLESKEIQGKLDFKKIQNDYYSVYAAKITSYILDAFENTKVKDNNLGLALDLLKKWNFEMDKYSQAPAIYAVYFQKLLKNIFEDEMGKNLLNEYSFIANIPYRVIPDLLEKNNSVWFDDVNSENIENRDVILRESLVDALEELESLFGKNIAGWQWGELHKITFKHLFSGKAAILDPLINIGPYPISGDGTTVLNTEYSFTDPYSTKLGPSMRYIFDFGEPGKLEFILPTGQSGHISSDHYDDMTRLWLDGNYLTLKLLDDYSDSDYQLLELIPGKFLN